MKDESMKNESSKSFTEKGLGREEFCMFSLFMAVVAFLWGR